MKNDESGFEDDPQERTCRDPGHKPPTHMVIPQGQRYRHVCPRCKAVSILRQPQVRLAA